MLQITEFLETKRIPKEALACHLLFLRFQLGLRGGCAALRHACRGAYSTTSSGYHSQEPCTLMPLQLFLCLKKLVRDIAFSRRSHCLVARP
ncbi:uncharacterized protein PITG_18955 [Phytophthora infestans T30-4]|uniref:Uncharacterized protein n=1 Tax=Phytophthora infestans (strain T30-4) TaxID=403677 RepID=D0P031_PHYIT|nr:uncharacterized protein PITG_18955 [Phytophthora infestans T30-4]EEY70191.1 hypothetical protein PITG_18955 [Phytophthora infestans T30-4]|eukprot:XP_002997052.1 hypothetical protein PITG_18955 [Phytophthora infestans T30-4]